MSDDNGKVTDPSVERMFYEDVREKKVTARGIHNRALRKKGFRGSVRFPSDNLKPSEIKKLSGKVVIYNVYDRIPLYEEFKAMSMEQKVVAMDYWLHTKKYTKEQILTEWGFDPKKQQYYFYDTIRRLTGHGLDVSTSIMPGKRGGSHKRSGVPATGKNNLPGYEEPVQEQPKKPNTVFNISWNDLNGVKGDELAERLMNIATIINKDKKYIAFVELGELREG